LNPVDDFIANEFMTLKTKVQTDGTSSPNSNSTNSLPIYELKALKFYKMSGICESLIYGNVISTTIINENKLI
jgi:hypothetical protein